MWQMDAIQDNIHLFLEVVPLLLQSVSGVPEDKERQYDQSAKGGLCAWQGAAIYNHSTRKVSNTVRSSLSLGSVNISLCRRAVMLSQCTKQQLHKRDATHRQYIVYIHKPPSIQTDTGRFFFFTYHFSGFCLIQHTDQQELLPSSLKCVCSVNYSINYSTI